jgi:hypothetical protein
LEQNQQKLQENSTRYGQHGAAQGGSLLASRVRCGRCGCRMSISYAGSSKARFTCDALRNHLHQTQCQSFNAKPLADLVERQVLIAISPASLELSIAAARQLETESLSRLRRDQASRMTESQVAHIETLAADIPSLWHNVNTSLIDKQHIVRELVEEVTVEVIERIERVRVPIRWTVGYESHHEILRAVGKFEQLEFSDNIRDRILQMKRRGHTHQAVAEDLNALGYQSAQKSEFTKAIIRSLCSQFEATGDSCNAIGGYEDYWTTKLLGKQLSIPVSTLRNWHARGGLCSIRSIDRWIAWADEKELTRLTRLAEHQQGPQCRNTPTDLTTPGKPT